MFEIEKGVPFPRNKYPWDEMEVGDSFLVPGNDPAKIQSNLVSAAWRRGKTYGEKYRTAQVVGGVRVWRVA